jgi:putative ABC transport system substrate-binding protein
VKQQHADAVLVLEEPVLGAPSRVAAGGLISYGTSQTEAIRHTTAYVDKVLKGAKPDALPVETVRRYELVVNLKTARDIGVTIPPEVLKRADRVIQ